MRNVLFAAALMLAPSAAFAQSQHYPTDGWTLPMPVSALDPAARDRILRSTDAFEEDDGKWVELDGCAEPRFDDDFAHGPAIRDLNGDGRPEIILRLDDGSCGPAGDSGPHPGGFAVLSPQPGGRWREVLAGVGAPVFLAPGAPGTWPDWLEDERDGCFSHVHVDDGVPTFLGFRTLDGRACEQPGQAEDDAAEPSDAP